MKNDIYSSGGRIINRSLNDIEIALYLGLENIVDNFNVVQEYLQLEEKYFNQNVDFCLICDIETTFVEPIEIIEKCKYIVVYK